MDSTPDAKYVEPVSLATTSTALAIASSAADSTEALELAGELTDLGERGDHVFLSRWEQAVRLQLRLARTVTNLPRRALP